MKSNIQLAPNKYVENMTKMFNKLYTEEQLTDITLWCKDGVIKAHKVVLATCSPYFHKIFLDNDRDNLVIVMHGINHKHLHNIIDLIYKGNVEVLAEDVNPLYELAGELQLSDISGVLLQETEENQCDINHCRDTRFKGLKRVAVDYSEAEHAPKKPDLTSINNEFIKIEAEEPKVQEVNERREEPPPKLSAWAKKQRKFKCNLCPSSFKRSSHLTRHQLVHTGERPFACDQCDKAFSRHDKLKHHIRKAHGPESQAFQYSKEVAHSAPLPFVISHVTSESTNEPNDTPAKRGRGRPRKYPLIPKPLIKRGRGRPRLNPISQGVNGENYDITNLPFGDLEYLTMPILPQTSEDSVMIEPFVEINTDKEEATEKYDEKTIKEEQIKHENIITKIAKIGECTISVASH